MAIGSCLLSLVVGVALLGHRGVPATSVARAASGAAVTATMMPMAGPAPDFASMTGVSARKEAFFNWLAPSVDAENARLMRQRRMLVRVARRMQSGLTLRDHEHALLADLAGRYKLAVGDDPVAVVNALLDRVDMIPSRLALAQAAIESGWGTSRFAREGSNYFGIWTWSGGGLVPQRRVAGSRHTVAAYKDAASSVRAYLLTLNAGAAYDDLRQLRREARLADREPVAYDLAAGLAGYSQRGQAYVDQIRRILRTERGRLDAVVEEL